MLMPQESATDWADRSCRSPFRSSSFVFCSKIIWFATMRCMFIATRIWVKKSAVIVHSTSTESDGSNGFPAAMPVVAS